KLLTVGMTVWAAAFLGCAAKKSSPPPPAPPPAAQAPAPSAPLSGSLGERSVTKTATVQKVDLKTRHVTLKRPDGTTFTTVVDPEVHNLPQVKKGDVVSITYKESVAYEVKKAGHAHPGAGAKVDVTRAAPGEKPGGTVTKTLNVRMTIIGIDKATS